MPNVITIKIVWFGCSFVFFIGADRNEHEFRYKNHSIKVEIDQKRWYQIIWLFFGFFFRFGFNSKSKEWKYKTENYKAEQTGRTFNDTFTVRLHG